MRLRRQPWWVYGAIVLLLALLVSLFVPMRTVVIQKMSSGEDSAE